MKRNLIISVMMLLVITTSAQIGKEDPFAELNKRYEQRQQKMEQEYAQRMQKMEQEYADRMKSMNAAFEKYLKKAFKEVEQEVEEEKKQEVPKPIKQPKLDPLKIDKVKADLLEIPKPVVPKVELVEAPSYSIAPIILPTEGQAEYRKELEIDFFGSKAKLVIDSRMRNLKLTNVKPAAFANYWNAFSKTAYPMYVESVMEYAHEKNLNDWGIYKLMEFTAHTLFASSNDRNMWMWTALNQAGYMAKIGYSGSKVCLMIPFVQEIYEKPFYNLGGYNYYLMDEKIDVKSLYTYEEDFGGATQRIDLYLSNALNFSPESNVVSMKKKLPHDENVIELKINRTIIDFQASYPQTSNDVYLNAAMSASVKDGLYNAVKPHLVGMSESESVTYLLEFLHNSFEYKTDRDQFGKEKMFFPDEIFYYPYSDCEDRTVLFTRMVNDLLGLDVVALTYFSHMAAAVSFSEPMDGYNFLVAGKKYTITDPTYINAPIGAVMPEYENYTPIAIKINNNNALNNIWQRIGKSIETGNEGNVFISDRLISENDKYIIAGWFVGNIAIGDDYYQANNGTRDLWFSSFNNQGEMEWFQILECSNSGFTQAFNVGKEGNVYALINYTGELSLNNKIMCKSETPAHFIFGITNRAQPILKENLDFEVPEGKKLAFYGKYKADGSKIDLVSFPTDRVRFDSKITVDSKNDIVVRGVVGEIEGLTKDVPINLSAATYSPERQMEDIMKKLNAQSYDKRMVPLFAAIQVLSQNGGSISGLVVRNLIQKNNPSFVKDNPKVYEGLLRMQFVVNKGGVVRVETYKKQKISLFQMSIRNNANLQINKTSDNSYKLNFLNGVEVGKAFIWYPLNSLSLQSNGKMTFDYDDDHTRKTINISEVVN